MKLLAVVGARPNFMKVAPILWEAKNHPDLDFFLVHTGQHYDRRMSQLFFEQLNLPRPDIDLGVGSGSHAAQTAEVMKRFEPVIQEHRPDVVLVVGDVNSTLACALTAVKLGCVVAHVEAGLRSFDRSMPEEINRVLTDQISRWLFVTEQSGLDNLQREGIAGDRVFFVGNVMIDTLLAFREKCEQSLILEDLGLKEKDYAVLTLHRPGAVDEPDILQGIISAIRRLQDELPIVFPVHPRTGKALNGQLGDSMPNLRLTEPLGYLDFMKLIVHARMVLTDSGGLQEETTFLGVPCLTLRHNTERPVTVEQGTNRLVGLDPDRIIEASMQVLRKPFAPRCIPPLWDGDAASRIVSILRREIQLEKGIGARVLAANSKKIDREVTASSCPPKEFVF